MKSSWKCCHMGKRKLNSRGMTLVEVIVAMAIIAVVVVPTLKMFSNASGINLRSRRATRAFTVGESVMECCKAYTVEQLCNQFKTNNFGGINKALDGSTTMSAVAITSTGAEISPFLADQTLKKEVVGYKLKVNRAESEGNYYDIVLDITPTVAPDAFGIEDRNAYTDAIISLEEDMNYDAVTELTTLAETTFETNFSTYHTAVSHTIDDIELTDFIRTITIDVDDAGGSQEVIVKVNYTCEAEVTYHYNTTVGGSSTAGSKVYDSTIMTYDVIFADDADPSTPEYTVYDNSGTVGGVTVNGRPGKLSQVYLYYFPTYDSIFGSGSDDVIVFNGNVSSGLYNPGSLSREEAEAEGCQPLKFIVAKQVSTYLDDFDLNSGEVLYNASVSGSLSGGGEVDVWHNLNVNLSPIGSVIAPSAPVGFSSVQSIKDAVEDRVNMLYDVQINVYEAGTTDVLAEYSGTINN